MAFGVCRSSGEAPRQQHQALLVIAGFDGADAPTAGALSERLMVAPRTATELAACMVEEDLITKAPSPSDRCKMRLILTAKAKGLLAALSVTRLKELKALEPALTTALARLSRDQA